ERVQPFGGRGHPRADDLDVVRVLVRLVRVHDARIAREAWRQREPRVAEREQHVRESLATVELEAALDGANVSDAPVHEARVPAGALPHLSGVLQELVNA